MTSSPRSQALSGVLLIDKPAGISSAEVTNRLKRKFKFDRIGHGGTLDPFATGLLVVLVGEATKVARFLLGGDKGYEATAILGSETDTGDHTGEIVNRCEPPVLSKEQWQHFAKEWTGKIRQTPPAYSAIKVKGRPLYDYARKGEDIEIPSREATVFSFDILETSERELRFRVSCSGGTYIRALAADLAMSAGGCAHLAALRRTASSSFKLSDAITLDAALAMPLADLPLRPLEEALAHLPQIRCSSELAQKIRQGNLAALESLRNQLEKPGFFLLLEDRSDRLKPVAVCNHNPMMHPFCSIERVFDPRIGEA